MNIPEHTVLSTDEGTVDILPIGGGKFRVTLQPSSVAAFIPRSQCETSLPPSVIAAFLKVSFARVCDSLARHDDPEYVQSAIRKQLLAYVSPEEMNGKRILDFGCGSGASTMFMGSLFPYAEVIGVELDHENIRLAREVLAARRLGNVRFLVSPDPNSLPPNIGEFDYVMLSAVYEHLLPAERRRVMPLIWSSMRDGAMLFINQTPYRYFPYEHHSTGLWGINYVPDRVAHFMARKFSHMDPRINRSPNWAVHLRGGIRGGTEGEILKNIRLAKSGRPVVAQPRNVDRAAYWLSATNQQRHMAAKKIIAAFFRTTDRLFGTIPSLNVDVVIRREPE